MNTLKSFTNLICSEFDNSQQIKELNDKGINNFPFAKHINTLCNDKITDIP